MTTESPSEPHPPAEENLPSTAFITGITSERANSSCEFPVVSSTFPGLMKTYNELMRTLEALPASLESLLGSHSDSCYLAYKTHMYGVQAEFAALLASAQTQETQTKQDGKIQSLEGELEWFMAEALRLDVLLTQSLNKEHAKLMTEISIASEDARFLAQQVRRKDRDVLLDEKPVERATSQVEAVRIPAIVDVDSAPNTRESAEIRKKRKDLESSRRELLTRESAKAKRARKLAELEALFLGSIEETRKHIAHCKHLGKATNIENSAAEQLIQNPQVLALLYERLFPWKSTCSRSHVGN